MVGLMVNLTQLHASRFGGSSDELAAEHAGWLRGKARIGITGGTSTPEVDLEEVRDRIYALTA
jgi:4-hydroxy-3-methylbut-2-enyl diphosphate reductase IspH